MNPDFQSMTFKKYGRLLQLRIESAADLEHVLKLDDTLWMANSAPRDAFVCDTAFLELLDADQSGRILSVEVRKAISWLLHMLADPSEVGRPVDSISLARINVAHPEGQKIRETAGNILHDLGRGNSKEISLMDVRERQWTLASEPAAAQELQEIRDVERLVLYHRWLIEFCNSYVSFARLFDPEVRALFETGTLIIDGRQFALNFNVIDPAAHATVARRSRIYVVYSELSRFGSDEKRMVATAVTSGVGNMKIGKNGVFVHRDGRLWNARVCRVIENPISFGGAILSPLLRVVRFVQSQFGRVTGSTGGQRPAEETGRHDLPWGAIGVAALVAAFAYALDTLAAEFLAPLTLLLAGTYILFAPLWAWMSMRRQDVAWLLEASGWAINGRIRMTRALRKYFARRINLPEDSRIERADVMKRYADYASRPIVQTWHSKDQS